MRGMRCRRLLCLAALAGSAVLIAWRGGAASYLLFWTALLVPLSALAYRRIIASRLRTSLSLSQATVLRGESVSCTLTLTNASMLPILDIRLRLTAGAVRCADAAVEQRCWLLPGETKLLTFRMDALHCGEAAAGAEELCARDVFGLTERRFRQVRALRVLPRTLHIQDLVIAPPQQLERQRTARSYFGETMPDGQLKPYLPGEDVRRIHWKASALQGRPILRNTVPAPRVEVVLLPDGRAALPAGEARFLAADSVIEGTLAIADHFLRRGIVSRVLVDGDRAVDVAAPADQQRLYDLCAGDFFTGTDRPDRMLALDLASQRGGRSYVILTWELDEAFIRRCGVCLDAGAQVAVVCAGGGEAARTLAGADRRIAFYQVTEQRDILTVLSGIQTGGGQP